MRTLSASPIVFLEADNRADSTASKRTSLPIPFSRPICSMTWMRSLFISVSRSLPSGRLRPVERWQEPRLGHQRPGHVLRSPVQPFERERGSRNGAESARKLRPAVQGLTHPAPHILAYRPRVLTLFLQLTCQAGRRDLELVPRPH